MIRRTAATVAAVVAAAGLAGAPVAAADTVPQRFHCAYPGMSQWYPRDMIVTIDAPATVTRGRPTPVQVKLQDAVAAGHSYPPVDNYVLRITLGGAGSGSVEVGNLGHDGIPAGSPWQVEGTGTLTFTALGTTTLTATYLYYDSPYPTYPCRVIDPPPVAETVTVVA